MQSNGRSHQRGKGKRRHGVTQLDYGIIHLHERRTFIDALEDAVHPCQQNPVDEESRRVLHKNRCLLDFLGNVECRCQDNIAGLFCFDNLDKWQHGNGIKEMEAHHAGRILQVFAHLGNIQRGCIGEEQALRLAGSFQIAENFLLDAHFFENGLDDEIAVLERFVC